MRISHLSIENFRSIRKLEVDLPQICALVGPNNAGKSNLLLAIQRVLGRDWVSVSSFEEDDVYGRDPEAVVNIRLTFDPPLTYRKYKESPDVSIASLDFNYTRYKRGEEKGQRRLEQSCLDKRGETPSIEKRAPSKKQRPEWERLIGIPADVRESVPLIYIGTNRSLKEHLPGARYSLLRQLFEDIDRDLRDPSQTIEVKQKDGSTAKVPRIERFERLMGAALELLRTDSFNELERTIKESALRQLGLDAAADADKLDFFFAPFSPMDFYKSLDLQVKEGGVTTSATQLGEGFQNVLVLAILQAFEKRRKEGAILLIEEPEMFLHPQMQRSLYKTFREVGKNNQVIYTTHSPHFVTVPDYDEVLLVRKQVGATTVRRSNLPKDEARREKMLKELDPERNELFFARRVLLVEGDTEKLALPEYAKRLGLDLDREGATIVNVGGKRDLLEFAKLAISFEIPVGVLYDEDSSDFADQEKQEKEFNAGLDELARADGSVAVWRLSKNYEDHLRKKLGEETYRKLCEKYGKKKPTRARLIAASEPDLPIPEPITDVLRWLMNQIDPTTPEDEDLPF